jgi:phage gpG-like protein
MKITLSGDAQNKLAELAIKSKQLGKPMKKAVLYQERQTKLNFAKQSTPDGAAWAALAPSTLARKKTSTILREDNVLINSINSEASGKVGRVFVAGAEYGIWHQLGTKNMPDREFMGISAENETAIEKIFLDHFDL